jgi:hypothetical protein
MQAGRRGQGRRADCQTATFLRCVAVWGRVTTPFGCMGWVSRPGDTARLPQGSGRPNTRPPAAHSPLRRLSSKTVPSLRTCQCVARRTGALRLQERPPWRNSGTSHFSPNFFLTTASPRVAIANASSRRSASSARVACMGHQRPKLCPVPPASAASAGHVAARRFVTCKPSLETSRIFSFQPRNSRAAELLACRELPQSFPSRLLDFG